MRDGRGGDRFEVQADNVINATGVWAVRIAPGELHSEWPKLRIDRANVGEFFNGGAQNIGILLGLGDAADGGDRQAPGRGPGRR